jgi:hypothetical protein
MKNSIFSLVTCFVLAFTAGCQGQSFTTNGPGTNITSAYGFNTNNSDTNVVNGYNYNTNGPGSARFALLGYLTNYTAIWLTNGFLNAYFGLYVIDPPLSTNGATVFTNNNSGLKYLVLNEWHWTNTIGNSFILGTLYPDTGLQDPYNTTNSSPTSPWLHFNGSVLAGATAVPSLSTYTITTNIVQRF